MSDNQEENLKKTKKWGWRENKRGRRGEESNGVVGEAGGLEKFVEDSRFYSIKSVTWAASPASQCVGGRKWVLSRPFYMWSRPYFDCIPLVPGPTPSQPVSPL